MGKSIECPLCQATHREPTGTPISIVPWSDECACSDYSICMFHKYQDEPIPKRPHDEQLLVRAAKITEAKWTRFNYLKEVFRLWLE